MSNSLTPRQKEVLDYVNNIYRVQGEFPTVRQIAEELGLSSPGNIHRILVILEEKGFLNTRQSSVLVELPNRPLDSNLPSITSSESKVYESVVETIGRRGTAPSIREISDQVGEVSIGSVHKILKSLERKGYITLDQSQAYGISMALSKEPKLYPVIIQKVPCDYKSFMSALKKDGAMIEALPLSSIVPNFVRADATSIFGAILMDNRQLVDFARGDYILFRRSDKPKIGDIVIANYRGRVVTRYLHAQSSSEILLSAKRQKYDKNSRFDLAEDIEAKSNEVEILGYAVSAILRNIGTRRVF